MAITEDEFNEVSELLTDCMNSPRLTDWETGFVADFNTRLHEYGQATNISPKQWDILERLRGKVYGT